MTTIINAIINVCKEIMGQATSAVEITEEASVWQCKPMQVMPMEDGRFKLVDNQ